MNSSAGSVLLVAGVVIVLLALLSVVSTVDIAGPVRSFLWDRDARKMQRNHDFPETLERAYWSRRQYDRDSERLRALGYRVTSEEAVEPFITLPSYPMFGRTSAVRDAGVCPASTCITHTTAQPLRYADLKPCVYWSDSCC